MALSKEARCTDWCITFNVKCEEDLFEGLQYFEHAVKKGNIQYMVAQAEQGESGNLHIQAFVICKTRSRWTSLAKQLAITGAHFERRQGTRLQAAAYCKKEQTRYNYKCETLRGKQNTFEWGELEAAPGEKGTQAAKEEIKLTAMDRWLEEAKKEVDTTGRLPDLEDVPAKVLFSNTFDKIACYLGNTLSYTVIKDRTHKALVLHGRAGAGKSYSACVVAEQIFGVGGVLKVTVSDKARLWFPPATVKPGARCLILDEFHWGSIAQDQLKALLSGDAPLLDVKGGYRVNTFEVVIITTNDDPHKWGAPWRRDTDGKWIQDNGEDAALVLDDNYQAMQRQIDCFDCSALGDFGNPQVNWGLIMAWLREKLSWAIENDSESEAEEEEGGDTQPLNEEDVAAASGAAALRPLSDPWMGLGGSSGDKEPAPKLLRLRALLAVAAEEEDQMQSDN